MPRHHRAGITAPGIDVTPKTVHVTTPPGGGAGCIQAYIYAGIRRQSGKPSGVRGTAPCCGVLWDCACAKQPLTMLGLAAKSWVFLLAPPGPSCSLHSTSRSRPSCCTATKCASSAHARRTRQVLSGRRLTVRARIHSRQASQLSSLNAGTRLALPSSLAVLHLLQLSLDICSSCFFSAHRLVVPLDHLPRLHTVHGLVLTE